MPLIKLFSKQRWKKCHWQSCSLNWEAEDVRRSLSTWSRIWSFLVSAALHNNQVCRLDIIEVKSLQDDRVTFRTTTIKVFELAGRLPTIQVGLKIFQICLPGWFPWLHGGEQDRVRAVQPRHFPRQHWRLPWPLAWSWSSSARTDPGATNLKAGSLENLLILTLQCKKWIGMLWQRSLSDEQYMSHESWRPIQFHEKKNKGSVSAIFLFVVT